MPDAAGDETPLPEAPLPEAPLPEAPLPEAPRLGAPPEGADPRHVVMVGPMASGKTTVGRLVAARLGWPLDDSDAWLAHATGADTRAIEAEHGIELVHELESIHLRLALGGPGPSVVAAAASTVDDPRCIAALRHPGLVVAWLRVDEAERRARRDHGGHRPHVEEAVRDLEELERRREPRFASVATLELDGGRPLADLVETIVAAVRSP